MIAQEIEIRSQLSKTVLIRFGYFHLVTRQFWLLLLAGFLIFVAGIATFALVGTVGAGPERLLGVAFMILFPTVLLLQPLLTGLSQFSSRPQLADPGLLTLNEKGIQGQGPNSSWTMNWALVQHVYETKSMILLYFARRQAVIIQKEYFVDDDQGRAVSDLITRRIGSHAIRRLWSRRFF